jgi:hypothetical protein
MLILVFGETAPETSLRKTLFVLHIKRRGERNLGLTKYNI